MLGFTALLLNMVLRHGGSWSLQQHAGRAGGGVCVIFHVYDLMRAAACASICCAGVALELCDACMALHTRVRRAPSLSPARFCPLADCDWAQPDGPHAAE